jgi:hypothetical protein
MGIMGSFLVSNFPWQWSGKKLLAGGLFLSQNWFTKPLAYLKLRLTLKAKTGYPPFHHVSETLRFSTFPGDFELFTFFWLASVL